MRKLALILAACMVVGALTGCQQGYSDEAKVIPVEQYVTLGEYKDFEVIEEITAETVEASMYSLYTQYVTAENGGIMDRAVTNGDTVNIDYVGKKDGVAFDGGTAEAYNLTIGSNSFIDGFEEGLVGVMPGQTVDLKLTFPKNYTSTDLAGKDVVFTVTVNFIMPTEMTDAVVAGFGWEGYTSVELLRNYVRNYIRTSMKQYAETYIGTAVVNNATFIELPATMLEKAESDAAASIDYYSYLYGMTAEDYCQSLYNMSVSEFAEVEGENSVKKLLVYQAIANAEGLNVSDKELYETLAADAEAAEVETIEEYLGDASAEDYRDYLMKNKVGAWLTENVTFTVN